ncbi:glycosyltransferase family 2 protein [Vibrio sp. 10N.261.55.A10]|uniref:glycosyltransferase family 2 protein n=1 Tax=Vibrio sp. 10N.261.55.A10 TaxID=3229687 RepID=UPI00354C8E72
MKKVAIITRTKNRAILLPRVLESLTSQTYKDFLWVIVNDAGVQEPVDDIADLARLKGIDVKVIHREESVGMEAASNDGILQSESEYILIHDDDDSLYPMFLEKTVKHLDGKSDQMGVVVQSTMVMEKITEKGVDILYQRPYNSWLTAVFLSDLIIQNQFPPISFLFKREAYDSVGGFDETLPVLGDWDFHLKCVLKSDIGVLPQELAYYHHRECSPDSSYSNSIIGSVDKHAFYECVIRNKHLRNDLENNTVGIGFLLTSGRHMNMISHRLSPLERMLNILKKLARKTRLDRFL